MKVVQLAPLVLWSNQFQIEQFLQDTLNPTIDEKSWMKDWKHISQRFQLMKLMQLPEEEILALSWDEDELDIVINETVKHVKEHIEVEDVLQITVFPAMPFPWFEKIERKFWTNGFTNSPRSLFIAIPPEPDLVFLKYLLAHEMHHASPRNPIYQLTADNFPLKEWYKMEGIAEYFSLNLFEDKRWWKDDFTAEIESHYSIEAKRHFDTIDDATKGPLCFGNPKEGIPYMAGYAFAYNLISKYVDENPINDWNELFEIESGQLMEEPE